MSNEEQRKRLELELKFLNESLEADIISKEEYKKGRERIERKLNEIEKLSDEYEYSGEEIPKIPKESKQDKPEIEVKEIEEIHEEINKGAEKIEKIIRKRSLEKEKLLNGKKGSKTKIFKKWFIILLFVIIIGVIILGFYLRGQQLKSTPQFTQSTLSTPSTPPVEEKQEKIVNEMKTDETKEPEVELIIINDNDCKLCDSSRIEGIIKEMFQTVKIRYIEYKTEEAKEMITQFGLEAIPSYIFASSINETINFNDFKRALIKKGDNYIMINTASGANYYFGRKKINNTLELFLTTGTEEAEKNIQGFLDVFKHKINFTKHLVNEKEKAKLKEELGINSYPVFLINNQFKVGGFQSAGSLKEKFCELNKCQK